MMIISPLSRIHNNRRTMETGIAGILFGQGHKEGTAVDKTAGDFIAKITEMTGKSREEIGLVQQQSGLTRHSDLRGLFMERLQLSYGFANTLAHIVAGTDGASLARGKDMPAIVDEIYSGKKEGLRPIHDLVMSKVEEFGEFETLPKKG